MNQKTRVNVAYLGIATVILYIIVVALYFAANTQTTLSAWETVTILSAPVILLVLLSILVDVEDNKKAWGTAAISFMTCTTALTGIAHFVNITVTRALAARGIAVPAYFQIGQWPSVEMAIDYLAWGFFTGLAFLCAAVALSPKMKHVKTTLAVSGCFCIIGMAGPIFNYEMLWFISVAGYAIGTPVICLQMISFYKKKENE